MARSFIIALCVFLYANGALGQLDNLDSLALYGIYPYPGNNDLQELLLTPTASKTSELSIDDINEEFSNIRELSWLEPIAVKSKVILIGETHYSTYINNIRNRIIFALNQYDYYPLLILEGRYSITPFVNHYLSISDNVEAENFFNLRLSKFVVSLEDSLLLSHVRRWNQMNYEKPISIGYSDMEWDHKSTRDNILKPYFQKLDIDEGIVDSIFGLGFNQEFLNAAQFLCEKAKSEQLIGDHSFITAKYIENVIINLNYTLNCYDIDFNFYRQKGIIRNLTDEDVFGKGLDSSKTIIFGGGNHTPTHREFPFGGNFLTEGSYLTFDYPPTKGSTYSIMLEGFAYTLGKMANVDASKVYAGSQYKNIQERMRMAYLDGFLDPKTPYFAFETRNSFTDLIIYLAYQKEASALLIDDIKWIELCTKDCESDTLQKIEKIRKKTLWYDRYIYVPHSPLNVLRVIKEQ